jgi:cytochrome c biogenesis protein CcmG/thiol:disulfide interchange protein DsbE
MRLNRRGALAACAAALLMTAAARPGDKAPSLVLPTIDGRTLDLAALRGKVVVVNYWATWCPPCRTEMPGLDAWYRARRSQGVEVIGVSADKPRDRDAVKRVMQPFAYPAGLEADAKADGFGRPMALPVTYVIDRRGVVRAVLTPEDGVLNGATLDRLVAPLLKRG